MQSGSTAEAEASSLKAEALQVDPRGPRGFPGQRALQPRGPHRIAPSRDVMQWPSVEVEGVSKLCLSIADRRHQGQRSSGMESSPALCRTEVRAVLGWGTSQSHLPGQPHHWHASALCQARGEVVVGALPAGWAAGQQDRTAGWGEDLLTGSETGDKALILAKFSALSRQGQGCSHSIAASLSQKCWGPRVFKCFQWRVCLQKEVMAGKM